MGFGVALFEAEVLLARTRMWSLEEESGGKN